MILLLHWNQWKKLFCQVHWSSLCHLLYWRMASLGELLSFVGIIRIIMRNILRTDVSLIVMGWNLLHVPHKSSLFSKTLCCYHFVDTKRYPSTPKEGKGFFFPGSRSFRLQVDSPTSRSFRLHDQSRFAYTQCTRSESIRLHWSRFAYSKYLLLNTKYLSKNWQISLQ